MSSDHHEHEYYWSEYYFREHFDYADDLDLVNDQEDQEDQGDLQDNSLDDSQDNFPEHSDRQ